METATDTDTDKPQASQRDPFMYIYASRTLGTPTRWILCYGDSGHNEPLTRDHVDLPFLPWIPETGFGTVVSPKQFRQIKECAKRARLEIVYF